MTAIEQLVEDNFRMKKALERIERWFGEFPDVVDSQTGRVTTYSYAWGSNGERDFMRTVAREALKG